MNNDEKNNFLSVINKAADIYDKKIPQERVSVYWEALKHLTLISIKTAINRHIQDADRGRYFPVPADITHQLPKALDPWLSANEAWAACPKDESASSAMCAEISGALTMAQGLVNAGDMIAARMAFIEHYNRLVQVAKDEGRNPEWFPSYGFDKETRCLADAEVIDRKNLALPAGQKIALPNPASQKIGAPVGELRSAGSLVRELKDNLSGPVNG